MKSKTQFARFLRQNQTFAERKLWNCLRNRQLAGLKFRRQHIINGKYIADFYNAANKIIIELDGSIHQLPEVIENDKFRENLLIDWGYQVLRFSNTEVINSINGVLDEILANTVY